MSQSRTCLIVDDEARVRGYMSVVMQSGGFEVIEAENGVEALATLRQAGALINLIISDINMPQMNGLALAALVRVEFPLTAVILVSGYAATPAGDDIWVLQKPFLPATLLNAANSALRSDRTLSAGA
jgi:CheY-like chemotaxis protein